MKKKFTVFFIIIIIALTAIILRSTHADEMLALSNVRHSYSFVSTWINQHIFISYFIYFLVFYILNSIHFPLSSPILPVLGGFFFNIFLIIPCTVGGMALSLLTKCLLVRYVAKDFKKDRWLIKKADYLLPHFEKNKFHYFFTSRFLPFFPRGLVIWLAARSSLSWVELLWWSMPCSIFTAIVYSYVGRSLGLYLKDPQLTWNDFLHQPALYFPSIIAILISSLSLLSKKSARRLFNFKESQEM